MVLFMADPIGLQLTVTNNETVVREQRQCYRCLTMLIQMRTPPVSMRECFSVDARVHDLGVTRLLFVVSLSLLSFCILSSQEA